MKKKKVIRVALAVLALGATSVVATSCGGEQQQQQAAMMQQSDVVCNMITIAKSDCQTNDKYSASIKGKQDVDVMPQVSGNLTQLCVKEGQRVHKGQVLFIIDQVPFKAALSTAVANVNAAKATVATAQLTYDSKKELREKNVISDFDLQQANNQLLTAKANLAQAEAQEVNARNSLSYTEVKSPVDGVVGTLPFRVGALVSPSMPTPLTTVSDNSQMYVYFSMTEKQMLEIVRLYGSKEKAIAQMPALKLQLSDGSVYAENGKLETISGVIDANTGAASFRAVFPNKAGLLCSGGSGNVIIPANHKDVIVIPQNCTFEIQDKKYVYKYVGGVASSAQVNVTGTDDGLSYIVNSGLSVGDVIVAEGVGTLREGTPIKPKGTEVQPAVADSQKVAADSVAASK